MSPGKKKQFKNESFSTNHCSSHQRRGISIKESFKSKAGDFTFYSCAIYESMDSNDVAQVAIFVRDVNESFDITEELAIIVPL